MLNNPKLIPTLSDFDALLQKFRFENKNLVFTNGCFDIIHPGHIDLLTKAKALGDILIVGLNSDKSIRDLKGDTRPINNLESRAFILSAMDVVDFVIPFSEPTPIQLVTYISPDLLVKGGDYIVENIVGFDHVTAHGGSVITIPFLEGYSSSAIIEKIKKSKI